MSAKRCIYCNFEYKSSDSRPFPNSKSTERIHNKCLMKKNLSDKKQGATRESTSNEQQYSSVKVKPTNDLATSLIKRVFKEEYDTKKAINEKKLLKLMEEKRLDSEREAKNSGQFFFDVKAGIAQEKKRYLHHRKVCEMATRFDDNGFKEEGAGRAYDHSGKDLNSLENSDNDNVSESEVTIEPKALGTSAGQMFANKRKLDSKSKQEAPKKQSKLRVDDQNSCWFCLSSPKVEKHLILAVGDFCYLTLAKGGLTDEHLLIIPIEHIQSMNSREDNSRELVDELERFKRSLTDYFQSRGKGVVFFERNFRSVHWQLQVVPVAIEEMDTIEERIKSISATHYKNSNYIDIPANCALQDMIPPTVPYLYWQLEPISKRLVTQIQVKGSFFPIQLGRMILADSRILDCPGRVDWKSCAISEEECNNIVRAFKEKYKEFDFT